MNKRIVILGVVAAVLAFSYGAFYRMFFYQPSPHGIGQNVRDTIQKGLKERNAEMIRSVFSEASAVTCEEIEDLLEYVGTIESLTSGGIGSGGYSKTNWKYTEYAYYGNFTAVMTDGLEYDVYFTAYAFNKYEPSKIGVDDLSFINKADKYDVYGVGSYYNEKGEKLNIYGHEIKEYKRKPKA